MFGAQKICESRTWPISCNPAHIFGYNFACDWLRSDHMQSCSIKNGREDIHKKEKRFNLAMAKLYPFFNRLLYVPFVLGRTKSIFVEILYSDRRRDDEDGQFLRLSLGEIPSGRGKAQRSDTFETIKCVTALLFFQAVYFSARAKAHKTTVRTPIVVQSLRDVFMFSRVDFQSVSSILTMCSYAMARSLVRSGPCRFPPNCRIGQRLNDEAPC
jgi:hypothetical protein